MTRAGPARRLSEAVPNAALKETAIRWPGSFRCGAAWRFPPGPACGALSRPGSRHARAARRRHQSRALRAGDCSLRIQSDWPGSFRPARRTDQPIGDTQTKRLCDRRAARSAATSARIVAAARYLCAAWRQSGDLSRAQCEQGEFQRACRARTATRQARPPVAQRHAAA